MNKSLRLPGLLACLLLLMAPATRAQISGQLDPCPFGGIFIGSNAGNEYVVLPIIRGAAYGWADGNYTISLEVYSNFTSISGPCYWEDVNDVTAYGVTAFGAVPGIVANITNLPSVSLQDGTPAARPTTADIQASISALTGVRPYPSLLTFLRLTFMDISELLPIECYWDILPVTFTAVNAALNGSNRAVISWTTEHENDINHFSIEKKNAYTGWKKIAEVLPGSGPTGSYSWTDTTLTYNPTYRIIEVSNKCKKTISSERSVTSAGTQTFNSIAPDCGPYIVGADSLCGTSRRLYYIKYMNGAVPVTWTVSPANLGTIQGNGLTAYFTPSSSITGNGTLTATITVNGVVFEVFNKAIRVGTSTECTPTIIGADAVCGPGGQVFKLRNLRPGTQTVTWSVSPANRGTIQTSGQQVIFTPGAAADAGQATITATLTQYGTTTSYTKNIMVGTPILYGNYTYYWAYDMGTGIEYFEVSPVLIPGTTYNQYAFYVDGSYWGNTSWYGRYLFPQESVNVEIRYSGACGPSSFYVTRTNPYVYGSGGDGGGSGGGFEGVNPFSVSPNPATANTLYLHVKPSTATATQRGVTRNLQSGTQPFDLKLYDKYGNLKKVFKGLKPGKTISIPVPELPVGLYFLHVLEQGRKPVVLKAWIEK